MKRLLNIGLFCLSLFTGQLSAAPMLTGNVSFDDTTDLYTYTYVLDTTGYDGNIVEVFIHQNLAFNFDKPYPMAHSEPENWSFVLLVGSAGPNTFEGSHWGWWKDPGTDNDISTFSFTTERGVNTSPENNYAIYNNSFPTPPSGFVEVGRIVGPELVDIPPVSPVPENETYAMMMAGLGMLGFISRRKSRKTHTPR